MDNVDFVLVGSEAVVESGGLINAVGSNQMAIIAKAANKPFYALAERLDRILCSSKRDLLQYLCSYKFHRLFPLSQYDLPTHNPSILSFPRTVPSPSVLTAPLSSSVSHQPEKTVIKNSSSTSALLMPLSMTSEQISRNPDVDYTRYLTSVCIAARVLDNASVKTRFNFTSILGCWASNAGRSVTVPSRHVRRLNTAHRRPTCEAPLLLSSLRQSSSAKERKFSLALFFNFATCAAWQLEYYSFNQTSAMADRCLAGRNMIMTCLAKPHILIRL